MTAVLEVNKDVGAWLLRQESIFWCLAEVALMITIVITMISSTIRARFYSVRVQAADTEDEELHKSLAEIYAHAAADAQHFRDKAGDEPIRQLKGMLRSPKPKVRCRACVALAKTSLIHAGHRPSINPTGQLLTATLSLFEKSLPPSVHRWAVEAFMWLSTMPDVKVK